MTNNPPPPQPRRIVLGPPIPLASSSTSQAPQPRRIVLGSPVPLASTSTSQAPPPQSRITLGPPMPLPKPKSPTKPKSPKSPTKPKSPAKPKSPTKAPPGFISKERCKKKVEEAKKEGTKACLKEMTAVMRKYTSPKKSKPTTKLRPGPTKTKKATPQKTKQSKKQATPQHNPFSSKKPSKSECSKHDGDYIRCGEVNGCTYNHPKKKCIVFEQGKSYKTKLDKLSKKHTKPTPKTKKSPIKVTDQIRKAAKELGLPLKEYLDILSVQDEDVPDDDVLDWGEEEGETKKKKEKKKPKPSKSPVSAKKEQKTPSSSKTQTSGTKWVQEDSPSKGSTFVQARAMAIQQQKSSFTWKGDTYTKEVRPGKPSLWKKEGGKKKVGKTGCNLHKEKDACLMDSNCKYYEKTDKRPAYCAGKWGSGRSPSKKQQPRRR